MIRSSLYLICFHLFITSSNAQIGGSHVFNFLNFSTSARTSALGGSLISTTDPTSPLAYENPALSTPKHNDEVSFQHQFLLADLHTGQATYTKQLKNQGLVLHGGFKYTWYGEFQQADVFGNRLGTFKGNDVALFAGGSYQLYDRLRIGANIKYISSSLEVYRSSGVAVDIGAQFVDTTGLFSAALVIRNAGTQISPYDNNRETLPLEVSVAISKKLKHLPFRFYLTYHHLQTWNLLYDDPNTEEGGFIGGFQVIDNEPSDVDNFFRHLIFGGEFTLGKNDVFKLRLGYNHQRKQELTVTNFRTLTGFSMGFGLKVKKLQFDYALSKIHFAGSTHHLGISTSLSRFTNPSILN